MIIFKDYAALALILFLNWQKHPVIHILKVFFKNHIDSCILALLLIVEFNNYEFANAMMVNIAQQSSMNEIIKSNNVCFKLRYRIPNFFQVLCFMKYSSFIGKSIKKYIIYMYVLFSNEQDGGKILYR